MLKNRNLSERFQLFEIKINLQIFEIKFEILKKIIFFVSLIFLLVNTYPVESKAKVIKLRAYSYSYKYYDYDTYKWSDWTEWVDCKILIVIDMDEFRIKIYSKIDQEYDIIDYDGEKYDYEGNTTLTYQCIDKNGLRNNIRFVKRLDDEKQLYIDYSDIMWVYSVYLLE